MTAAALPIAITMGDPAGIGPEIIAQLFRQQPEWSQRCFAVGDLATLRRAAAVTGGLLPVAVIEQPADVFELPPRCLPVLPAICMAELAPWGRVDALAGRAAADSIAWAAQAALRGEVGAVVTAPICARSSAASPPAGP